MTNTCSAVIRPLTFQMPEERSDRARGYSSVERSVVAADSGGTARSRPSLRVRRRRALLAAAAVVGMVVLLALPWGGTGGHSLATPGAAHGGALVPGSMYVVRPGDTVWGLATRLAGGSDPQPVVQKLESEAGGDNLRPGQILRLP